MTKRKTWKSAVWGRSILVAAALMLGVGVARAGAQKLSPEYNPYQKLSPDLYHLNPSTSVNIIVQFNRSKKRARAMDLPAIAPHTGAQLSREFPLLNAAAYRQVPVWALGEIARDPAVFHISLDHQLHGAIANPVLDYHNETINSSVGWNLGLNGAGIGVAVIDSGLGSVDDLTASNVVYAQDFTGANNPADQYGHGTHVAGIIAGNGHDSSFSNDFYTFHGIASGVNLVNLRVLDSAGNGSDSNVIAAIQAAIQIQNTYNIRVINLSVGRGVFESYTVDPLCQAVEQAWAAGIVVVVSAGNEGRNNSAGTGGYGTITAPGNDPYVITVGAMNTLGTPSRTDDIPTTYTSRGPTLFDQIVKPDLVAPGNLIISLYKPGETLSNQHPSNETPLSLYQKPSGGSSSSYFFLSGTSMAAPMVTGAAALMLQQTPALTPDQVKARLMLSAFKNLIPYSTITDHTTGTTYHLEADLFTVGAGYLDIQAALNSTTLAPSNVGSALSPYATVDGNANVVMVLGSPYMQSNGLVWGTGMVWGTGLVWGTDVILGADASGNSIVFAPQGMASEGLVWGSSTTVAAEGLVWGTGMVWGTSSSASETTDDGDDVDGTD